MSETNLLLRIVGNYRIKQAEDREKDKEECCVCNNAKFGTVLVEKDKSFICVECLLALCENASKQKAESNKLKEKERLCCCIPDQTKLSERCQQPAEYEICYGNTVDDFTDSCLEHIPAMMTNAQEHRIYRIG